MLDLNEWQLDGAAENSPPSSPRSAPPKRRAPFLKGPVPLAWLAMASCLPGRALAVGVVLWFQAGLQGAHEVKLTNQTLGPFGVDRFAKRRALDALAAAGLVSVTHHRGRSPLVRLHEAPQPD